MTEFEFVNETPKRSGGQPHVDPERKALADACRANPDQWLRVPERFYKHLKKSSYFSQAIKSGQITAFKPKGTFDAKTRDGIVFMKYIGGKNDGTAPE